MILITLMSLLLLVLAAPAVAGPLDGPGVATAVLCSACHGFAGQSQSNTMPILAGMAPWYFKKAIQDFAAGRRTSPEMEPYAKQVVQFGLDDVAAYFAAQARTTTPVTSDPAAIGRGRQASAPCALCHGASGKGDPSKGVPDLTGQPPGYLRSQMLLFKADKRSPGDAQLKVIKALMMTIPDDQLADLAAYWSSVR